MKKEIKMIPVRLENEEERDLQIKTPYYSPSVFVYVLFTLSKCAWTPWLSFRSVDEKWRC